jgi:hypothetical protein
MSPESVISSQISTEGKSQLAVLLFTTEEYAARADREAPLSILVAA